MARRESDARRSKRLAAYAAKTLKRRDAQIKMIQKYAQSAPCGVVRYAKEACRAHKSRLRTMKTSGAARRAYNRRQPGV